MMYSKRVSQRTFLCIAVVVFAASAAGTVVYCSSMSAMGDIPMPGGWAMSTVWAPMCGRTWAAATLSFLVMWMLMMVAMMSPSFAPVLWQYRDALCRAGAGTMQRNLLTAFASVGYFLMWAAFGVAAFVIGVALGSVEMRWPLLARAVPFATGALVSGGGMVQLTWWKAHYLACCKAVPGHGGSLPASAHTALRYGARHGIHCGCCCAGLTAILLADGIMNLAMMACVTTAITAERMSPAGERIARATGVVAAGAGLWLMVRATGLV